MRGDDSSQRFCVSHNGFEVLDADHYMHVLLHVEVFEILCMDRDRSLERLLQYFYLRLAYYKTFSLNQHYLCHPVSSL